jgi:ABC-2 type transport system permease protein
MKRYLKLYWQIFSNLVSLLWALFFIFAFVIIYQHVEVVNGWTQQQVILLLAVYFLSDRIFDTLFEINFGNFVYLVNSGELDLVLTKPVSAQFVVSLRRISFSFLLSLLAMLGLVVYLAVSFFGPIRLTQWILFVVLLISGVVISYSLWFMSLLPVFWWGRVENIHHLFRFFHQLTRIPLDITGPILRPLLTYVLPLIFIVTVPAQSLLGIFNWPLLVFAVLVAIFLLWLSSRAWRFSLRHYGSASS